MSLANRTPATTFTVDEVAARYGVSPETVSGWVVAGELTGVNVSRSRNSRKPRWRFTEAALTAFEAARSSTPAAPAVPRTRQKKTGDIIEFYS